MRLQNQRKRISFSGIEVKNSSFCRITTTNAIGKMLHCKRAEK